FATIFTSEKYSSIMLFLEAPTSGFAYFIGDESPKRLNQFQVIWSGGPPVKVKRSPPGCQATLVFPFFGAHPESTHKAGKHLKRQRRNHVSCYRVSLHQVCRGVKCLNSHEWRGRDLPNF
ncbi:MAG: hypothetical protein ACXVB9_22085, partial [Bdellovibrionota bacterium]